MAELEAKYGLPTDVRFCKRCVISNQRPNSAVEFRHTAASKKETIHFDDEDVCDACRYIAQKKNSIDWNVRERELKELCSRFRKDDGSYDCLVPGSGGKDSFYAAYKLKFEYGMHPLTVTWAPHMYTPWGWKNFQSWIHAGFDNYLHTPNGKVHRLLTRLAVERLFHPFQPFMLGQKFLAPKLAAIFNIPLVFYGEMEAEYGNPIAETDRAERNWSYFTNTDPSSIFIGGTSIKELQERYAVTPNDILTYLPADPEALQAKKIQVHYLGYYLRWHPQECYYYAVEHGGFQASPERTPGTYSKYNSIDDKIDDLHYYTTWVKFGIGRATYDAAQEIRSGDITREEGVALVHRFDGEYPTRFEEDNFRYLSIPEKEFGKVSQEFAHPIMDRATFMALADNFRSPHLWKKTERDEWELRYKVS
ncbi:MAG: N-acetyl sugar amidotransferase [Candidatus Peribacteraceae bacterium]|nr:N-acetyl sugar amidotransferase [Candidatus Peribacteraceae bacterium]MDD5739889.1 N-acetyl sugar amidotransferase [Candidatus Peribacteraceae bacterium]